MDGYNDRGRELAIRQRINGGPDGQNNSSNVVSQARPTACELSIHKHTGAHSGAA